MSNLDSLHVHVAVQGGPLLCASFVGVGILNFAILKRFWAFSSRILLKIWKGMFFNFSWKSFHEAHIIVHLRSPFHPLWLCQHLPPEGKNTFEYFRTLLCICSNQKSFNFEFVKYILETFHFLTPHFMSQNWIFPVLTPSHQPSFELYGTSPP